jgi:hypothetical protein
MWRFDHRYIFYIETTRRLTSTCHLHIPGGERRWASITDMDVDPCLHRSNQSKAENTAYGAIKAWSPGNRKRYGVVVQYVRRENIK